MSTLPTPWQRYWLFLTLFWCLLTGIAAGAGIVVRKELEPGVHATVQDGRALFLECQPPRGEEAQTLLQKYLKQSEDWRPYKDRLAVAIPYVKLNEGTQRRVIEAVLPHDYVDADGWWHTVTSGGAEGAATWRALTEWVTGAGKNFERVVSAPQNKDVGEPLHPGQVVLIPAALLLPEMKKHSAKRPAPPMEVVNALDEALETSPMPPALPPKTPVKDFGPSFRSELEYASDREGPYAVYRMKRGEAMYSGVVVRFTDYHENADIHAAIAVIAKRSGIKDPAKIAAGQAVRIPLEMLSDRYQPAQSAQRQSYEAVRQEAAILRQKRFGSDMLEGVVVILDPGHGGKDHGASHPESGLYEDELNYDIACRIKLLLETQTKARVYMTLYDPVQGYTPRNVRRFVHDTNEVLLTTPQYANTDAKISANLRWYLANKIYREELKKGTDERKIIFASIHCDALFNSSLRGAMVYIPGAEYRRDREQPGGAVYASYQEVRAQPSATTTAAQRRRDEAVSYNFAVTLLRALARNNPPIKVHDTGDPIRNVIRQSGGRAYVPAVLRNTMVPTKVLVEAANLTNAADRQRLADPVWRQAFAEAFVTALKDYYD